MRNNRLFIITPLLLLTLLLTACTPAGKQFDYYTLTFTYPNSWQPLGEVSESYQSGGEFLWMGIQEDLTVTSVKAEGEPGAYFSVASAEATDWSIDSDVDFMYAMNESDMRNYAERPITVAGIEGLSATYERNWQNQWTQFHDVWIRNGSLFYLLSFRADDLESQRAEMEMILESFKFK